MQIFIVYKNIFPRIQVVKIWATKGKYAQNKGSEA